MLYVLLQLDLDSAPKGGLQHIDLCRRLDIPLYSLFDANQIICLPVSEAFARQHHALFDDSDCGGTHSVPAALWTTGLVVRSADSSVRSTYFLDADPLERRRRKQELAGQLIELWLVSP